MPVKEISYHPPILMMQGERPIDAIRFGLDHYNSQSHVRELGEGVHTDVPYMQDKDRFTASWSVEVHGRRARLVGKPIKPEKDNIVIFLEEDGTQIYQVGSVEKNIGFNRGKGEVSAATIITIAQADIYLIESRIIVSP